MTEISTAGLAVGMALMERRSRAVADYLRSFATAREPADLVSVQMDYLRQMMDDYAGAFAETLAPLKAEHPPEQADTPARKPVQPARAA